MSKTLQEIKECVEKSANGMIALDGKKIVIHFYDGEIESFLVTDVSTFDSGDLRISGFVNAVETSENAFTLIVGDGYIDTIPENDLRTLLNNLTGAIHD